MIAKESFTRDWINHHRERKQFAKINPPVVEKMIHALALLEALGRNKLSFVFKGGTSLVLLLPDAKRFSIDIDILTLHTKEELETIFNKVVDEKHFTKWELDNERSYNSTIPKAHYFFYFNSIFNNQVSYILLDVLIEQHRYPTITSLPVTSPWLHAEGEHVEVDIPDVESILGDKLTAFAPNTTGVPYGKNKSVEIVKQLHDVGHLFDYAEDIKSVFSAFMGIAEQEIKYRNLNILPDTALDDIIQTSLLIGQTVKHHTAENTGKYSEIILGLTQFKGFLMTGSFPLEAAIESAAKAAYLAAKIKTKEYGPIQRYGGGATDFQFQSMPYNSLNRLKKIRNGSMYYWSRVAELLEIK